MISNLSIGILSWKSRKSLANTLLSYKKNGLLNLTKDVTILFQEISDEDRDIAKITNLSYIGLDKNIGIGKAFMMLAENSKNENILLLEHDWELVEDASTTSKRLQFGISMLDAGYDAIRYRHRKKPGFPLFSYEAYNGRELQHYDPVIDMMSPHLMDASHWIENLDEVFPEQIQKINHHYVTTSRWSNWNNNPCLYKRDFYIDTVRPFLNEEDLLLEPVISHWWARQNFKVAWGDGLFQHNDIEKYGERN